MPKGPWEFMSSRIHEILTTLFAGEADTTVLGPNPQVEDIISALGPRSFGLVLVLFGLPNLLPVPGLPILCGFIIGLIALQMVLGKDHLALPGWLGTRRLKRDDMSRIVRKAMPTLEAVERFMKPRLENLTAPGMQRLIGAAIGLLAVALMAPIPFFGGIAPGFAVVLFGLGLAARDGVFILLGAIASIFAVIITVAITLLILKSVAFLVI
jgi:hypothetical protein